MLEADMKEVFASLRFTMAADSRDWSVNPNNAWIYGIVVGWSWETVNELCAKFGWDPRTGSRLQRLHAYVERLRD